LCTLGDLHELTVGRESDFLAPHLFRPLDDLKAGMLSALSLTDSLAPGVPRHGLRGLNSRFKTWLRRHDVELAIQHLKEHVNKCFIQFTAFSAARTEYTALCVEQAIIVHRVEHSVKLQRLEGMMEALLLDAQIGNDIRQKTADSISSVAPNENYLLPSLCDALAQGSIYLAGPGYNQGQSASTSELAETRATIDRHQNSTLTGRLKLVEILTVSTLTTSVFLVDSHWNFRCHLNLESQEGW